MKRKAKRYDEGGKVYDKEDEGLLGAKIKYREDEEGRKYTAGRANPMDRNPQEQRYYSADDIKGKLSGLFGGKKEDTSKFDELESVGGSGRRARTIEEQIKGRPGREIEGKEFAPYRRTPEPKVEPKADAGETSGKLPGNQTNKMSFVDKKDAPYEVEKAAPKSSGRGKGFIPLKDKEYPKDAKPKAPVSKSDEDAEGERGKRMEEEAAKQLAKNKAAGSKQTKVGEDAKPLPGVSKDKTKPQNLPGVSKDKSEPKPYKESNRQKLGATYATMYSRLQDKSTPEGPGKEALKKAVAKAKKDYEDAPMKKGGAIKAYAKGGSVKSASARADGIAIRGKTRA
jgi:hypothetical protein